MKADRLHKFNSLALPKLENTKQTNKKHVSSTVVLIIRTSKLYYTASSVITPIAVRPIHSPPSIILVDRVYCCSCLQCIVLVVLCVLL